MQKWQRYSVIISALSLGMSGKVIASHNDETPIHKDNVEQQLLQTDIFKSRHLGDLPPVVLKKLPEKHFGSSMLIFNSPGTQENKRSF